MDAEKETARYVTTISPDRNYEEIQLEENPGIGGPREGTQQLGSRVALAPKSRSAKNRLHCSCEHGTDGEASASDASATYKLRVSPKFLLVSAVVVAISALALSTLALFKATAAISKTSQTCLGKRLEPVNRLKKQNNTNCHRLIVFTFFWLHFFSQRVVFLCSGEMHFIVKSADKMTGTLGKTPILPGDWVGKIPNEPRKERVFLT